MKKLKSMSIVVTLSLANAIIFAIPFLRYVLYDAHIDALKVTNTQLGAMLGVFGLSCLVLGPIGGWIVDRIGIKLSAVLSLAASGLLTLWYAMFPPFAVCLVIFALFGLTSQVVFYPAYNKGVLMCADQNTKSSVYGLSTMVKFIGTTLLQSFTVTIFAQFVNAVSGLQAVFLIFGAIQLAAAIICALLLRGGKDEKSLEEKTNVSRKQYFEVLKMPEVWFIGLIMFCAYFAYLAMGYFTPYATNVLKLPAVTMGFIATLIFGPAKFISGPVGGFIADKIKSPAKLMLWSGILAGITLFILSQIGDGVAVWIPVVIAFIIYFTIGACYNIGFTTVSETQIPDSLSGTAMGIMVTLCFLPDLFTGVLFGYFMDKMGSDGFRIVFQMGAGVLVVMSIVCFIFLARKNKAASLKST